MAKGDKKMIKTSERLSDFLENHCKRYFDIAADLESRWMVRENCLYSVNHIIIKR